MLRQGGSPQKEGDEGPSWEPAQGPGERLLYVAALTHELPHTGILFLDTSH